MGAVYKLKEYTNNRRMKIPLQTEVARYIEEKMGWPKPFCTHYANRFWDYYNSQGWKLSNNVPMKNWQSAFNSRWQTIKDEADKKLLEDIKRKMMTPIEKLDMMLAAFPAMFPDNDTAVRVYDYLKKTGVFKIPGVVQNKIKEDAGNNRDRGKVMCVQYIFEQMIEQKQTFKDVLT